MDKVAIIQHSHTVQMETVQANDMVMQALEYQHRTPEEKGETEVAFSMTF